MAFEYALQIRSKQCCVIFRILQSRREALLDRIHPVPGIGGKSPPADTNQLPQLSTLSDTLADDAERARRDAENA